MKEIEEGVEEISFEVIFVNDGSTDKSLEILNELTKDYVEHDKISIVVVDLRRNSGQTAAMRAGFSDSII